MILWTEVSTAQTIPWSAMTALSVFTLRCISTSLNVLGIPLPLRSCDATRCYSSHWPMFRLPGPAPNVPVERSFAVPIPPWGAPHFWGRWESGGRGAREDTIEDARVEMDVEIEI